MSLAWEWRMGRLVNRQTDDDVLVLADWFDVDQQDGMLIEAAPRLEAEKTVTIKALKQIAGMPAAEANGSHLRAVHDLNLARDIAMNALRVINPEPLI